MKFFISGGAGFIGSNLVGKLLGMPSSEKVIVYDNFSSGTIERLADYLSDDRLIIVRGEISDLDYLTASMQDVDTVFHLAANPYISKAVEQPDIDFWEGTYLTQNILEAARKCGVKKLIYSSGSGVYGENAEENFIEGYGPCKPISTYGASKLGCEALISAYCHMFSMQGFAFRFANVVGPKQTHGVGYDFLHKLKSNHQDLEILGDGSQSKPYIYVDDVLSAIFLVMNSDAINVRYEVFNVATNDFITVTQIADEVCRELNIKDVKYLYTGGDRGWKGDVPKVQFNSSKIRAMGWSPKFNSREAIYESLKYLKREIFN